MIQTMELEDSDDLLQEFEGGTLQINSEDLKSSQPNAETKDLISSSYNNKNIWNDSVSPIVSNPQHNSVWNKQPNANNNTTSLKPSATLLLSGNANEFFTFRQYIIEQAIKECMEQLLDIESDGPVTASFLLTEISLWDTEKERLVLLTPKTLIVVKYDFIALRRLDHKKLDLNSIDTVVIGDLVYPPASIVPHLNGFADGVSTVAQNCFFHVWSKNKTNKDLTNQFNPRNRNMQGIRLMWNKGKPLDFGSRWNPLCNDIPFITFTAHPLFFHKDCTNDVQKKAYDVEQFISSVCSLINNFESNDNKIPCSIYHRNIIMDNYCSIGSLIHNRNALGFFKVRGRFSF